MSPADTAAVRCFRGKYRVEAICGNTIQEQYVTLEGDKTLTFNINCSVRTREQATDPVFWLTPNPVRNKLTVRWNENALAGPVGLRIADVAGRVLADQSAGAPDGLHVFDTASWPPGLYFLTFENDGRRRTARFVVQR